MKTEGAARVLLAALMLALLTRGITDVGQFTAISGTSPGGPASPVRGITASVYSSMLVIGRIETTRQIRVLRGVLRRYTDASMRAMHTPASAHKQQRDHTGRHPFHRIPAFLPSYTAMSRAAPPDTTDHCAARGRRCPWIRSLQRGQKTSIPRVALLVYLLLYQFLEK
jgi:hypothetical protein